jgi:hypothetical protein
VSLEAWRKSRGWKPDPATAPKADPKPEPEVAPDNRDLADLDPADRTRVEVARLVIDTLNNYDRKKGAAS